MKQPFRREVGGLIDRGAPVHFSFNGRSYQGYVGDTLASALIANGVHMVARSFKYHRPRGILGAGPEDPAGMVQLGKDKATTVPNTKVTEQEIYDGLTAYAQNCWPALRFDVGVVNDWFSAFLPAGFYYKTFQGPPGTWKWFEPVIRYAAGLGKSPTDPDPDYYEHTNRHCDVLVIGGGAAGLMAALSAASTGARVILAEESAHLGGTLLSTDPNETTLDHLVPVAWIESVAERLAAMDNTLVLRRSCAFGYYSQNLVGVVESVTDHQVPRDRDPALPRQRVWRIRAKQVVLATGAIERPLMFHHNDRPGIMLAGAVRSYLHRYGVMPGHRSLVFTNNDSAWQTAFDIHATGSDVIGIVDVRATPPENLMRAARERGIPVHPHSVIVGTRGSEQVKGAQVAELNTRRMVGGAPHLRACDVIAVSGGWSPNVALFSQSRGKLRYDDTIAAFRPGPSWQNECSAGACNGTFGLKAALREGVAAGIRAAQATGFKGETATIPKVQSSAVQSYGIEALWELPSNRPPHKTRAFVDIHNDVTTKDLHLAQREGYRSVEHTKRYTTTGMGSDQGKTVGINAFGIIAGIQDKPIPEVGITTYRQPYKPITIGALGAQHVGEHFHPRRTTAMHEAHVTQGALFEPVGDWLRAWAYPRDGETFHQALMRECKAARTSLGVLDASTLGKIDIRGPDAREFLNRVYTNAWTKLKPGHCRYGLMLGEDGMVMDDGVTSCIDNTHFHMTTTTGGAARVLTWLEDYLQTEWPELQIYLTSVTEQWAVVSLCGPNSLDLMREMVEDLDPNPDTFPFMTWKEARIEGVPVRVFRISFTGELSYEINIPATYGLWLWERIMAAGAKYNITPYGTEGMHLLRAEKGYIIVGQDTDGTVTPHDLRMDWIVKKKADFIGKRSLSCADIAKPGRKQLVGLLTDDTQTVLEEGAQIIATPEEGTPPVPMLGHVTSSYFSPNLNRSIALALVKGGGDMMGRHVYVSDADGQPIPAIVTDTDFLELLKGGQS